MYEIDAFLAHPAELEKWKKRFGSVAIYHLREDLGLAPIIGALELGLRQHPPAKSKSELADAWGEEASQGCTVAYVTAFYHGGAGEQHAWVWRDRRLLLNDGDINHALRLFGVKAKSRMDEFDTVGLGRFRRPERWAAAAVIQEIVKGSEDPIPALIEALRYEGSHDIQGPVRSDAAEALAKYGTVAEGAISALVQTIKTDADYGVRLSSASALASMGPEAAEALRMLLATVGDKDRWGVVYSLGKMGPLGAVAVSELVSVLKSDPDYKLRYTAAEVLGRIGPDARVAIPALIQALHDENEHVRYHSIEALGAMGPEAQESIPALEQALKDKDLEGREAAAVALKRIKGHEGGGASLPGRRASISAANRPRQSAASGWLWSVRTLTLVSMAFFCAPLVELWAAGEADARMLVFALLSAIPYLLILWGLRSKRAYSGLVISVPIGYMAFLIELGYLWVAADRPSSAAMHFAALGSLSQLALASGAIVTRRVLRRHVPEMPPLNAHILIKAAVIYGAPFLIFLAIAIPSLLRSRLASSSWSPSLEIRRITAAEAEYASTYNLGYSPSLAALGPPAADSEPSASAADLIDSVLASGVKRVYRFEYRPGPVEYGRIQTYTITARPTEYGVSAISSYLSDQTGVIHSTSENRPATADDPPME